MRRTSIAALFALSAMVWGCSSNSKCKTDHDCNAAKRCVVSTGKCEPLTCSSDSACPVGYTCTNNFCFEQDLGTPPDFDLQVGTTGADTNQSQDTSTLDTGDDTLVSDVSDAGTDTTPVDAGADDVADLGSDDALTTDAGDTLTSDDGADATDAD